MDWLDELIGHPAIARDFNLLGYMVWLVKKAADCDGERIRGVECQRGQLFTTVFELCEVWQRQTKCVRRVIRILKEDKLISTNGTNRGTLITVCQYERYASVKVQSRQTKNANAANQKTENGKPKGNGAIVSDSSSIDNNIQDKDSLSPVKEDKENNTTSISSTQTGKISYDWKHFRFEGILPDKVDRWQEAYPAIDIRLELARAARWLEDNPKNRKSNYNRFLNGWFSRAQDKAARVGGTMPFAQIRKSGDPKRDPDRGWNDEEKSGSGSFPEIKF